MLNLMGWGWWILYLAVLSLPLLEAGWFIYVYRRRNDPDRTADVIVVFTGNPNRVIAGYKLANAGRAPYLVISSASDSVLARFDEHVGLSPDVVRIKEDLARTTFENAVIVARIIVERDFRRIILITDWFHMPRAWFLLRLMLPDRNRRLIIRKNRIVPKRFPQPGPWKIFTRVYNEFILFWGSLLELAAYGLSGRLPSVSHNESPLIKTLKAIILL